MENKQHSLDEELGLEEMEDLKRKMCGPLYPRKLTQDEIEKLKKEGRI